MTLIDENAYGLYVVWLAVEDQEYSLEAEDFSDRLAAFEAVVLDRIEVAPPGAEATATMVGHGVYVEVADGDETVDPFRWVKETRASLQERDFDVVAALTHGSRWVPDQEDPGPELPSAIAGVRVQRAGHSSEAWRRALLCEAGALGSEERGDGWGPGLYVDTEAVEAMGKSLKNAPTTLEHGGATFYRFGKRGT